MHVFSFSDIDPFIILSSGLEKKKKNNKKGLEGDGVNPLILDLIIPFSVLERIEFLRFFFAVSLYLERALARDAYRMVYPMYTQAVTWWPS